jgi:hypothetical protein
VTKGSVREEITGRIRNVGTFYHLVRDMLWKCLRCLCKIYYMPILTWSRYVHMDQGRY